MIRNDTLGVISAISDLNLSSNCYSGIIHFFLSDDWKLQDILTQWGHCAKAYAPIYQEAEMRIHVGDGSKQPKEACNQSI